MRIVYMMASSIFYLLVMMAFCMLDVGQCSEDSEAFEFLSVSKMATFVRIEGEYIYHLEPDNFVKGNILYSDQSSLKSTDRSTTTEICRVSLPTGFFQVIPDSQNIIVVARGGNCLKVVNRLDGGRVYPFVGLCVQKGYRDGQGVQALFTDPHSIIPDVMRPGWLIVTDGGGAKLRWIDMQRTSVETLVRISSSPQAQAITQNTRSGDLFVTTYFDLVKVDYNTKVVTLLAGTGKGGFLEGPLVTTQFDNPFGLALLANSKVILADYYNDRLRVLDLQTNSTTSICGGFRDHQDGDLRSCKLKYPSTILVKGDVMYVGEYGYIRMIKGRSLDLSSLTTKGNSTFSPSSLVTSMKHSQSLSTMITTTATTPVLSSPPCSGVNITLYLSTWVTTVDVKIESGKVMSYPAGNHSYITERGCVMNISVLSEERDRNCPNDLNVFSSVTGLAEVTLTLHNNITTLLPVGVYPFQIKQHGRDCSFNVTVYDYRIVRRLIFTATYDIQCTMISDDITRASLTASVDQHFNVIENICQQDCQPAVELGAIQSCNNNLLTVDWPTNVTFTANYRKMPDNLKQRLEGRNPGLAILPLFIIKKLPPLPYPTKLIMATAHAVTTVTWMVGSSYNLMSQSRDETVITTYMHYTPHPPMITSIIPL